MRARRLMVALIVAAAICFSPGALLRWKIGQSVAAKMPEVIGQAGSYSAHVSGGVLGIVRGRIERVDIRGRDVKMANGVVVDHLNIDLTGVHFRPDQTVTKVEAASFEANVTEDDLNNWIATSRPDLHDGHLTIDDGKLTLTAKPRVMLIRTPVKVEGTLQIVNQTKLNMVLNGLAARGIRVPGFVRGRIQHDINPVLDTEQMGIGAKLKSVQVSRGSITVTGTADVNKALAKG